jgi:hypothetical protein
MRLRPVLTIFRDAWNEIAAGMSAVILLVVWSNAAPVRADGTTICLPVAGERFVCDDGVGYVVDAIGQMVSRYDPADPAGGVTDGPWPLEATQSALSWTWVDPVGDRVCQFDLGNRVSSVTCAGGQT